MGCAVPECPYGFQSDFALIQFPENESLRQRWTQALELGSGLLEQSTDNRSCGSTICSWHFEDKSFSSYQEPCLFVNRKGSVSEISSCRICLQFFHRDEMVDKDSKLGKKNVSGLIKTILGLTLAKNEFLMQICEECLVKLDICMSWIQEVEKLNAQFKELAEAAQNENIIFMDTEKEHVELREDQVQCVDELIEPINNDEESGRYVAFEVDLIDDPEMRQGESKVEFIAVASEDANLLSEKSPKQKRRRGPGRSRKHPIPTQVDFKDILARKCYICNTLHGSYNDLVGHLPTHAANTDYQCIECGDKWFNKVSSYNHHLSFHDLQNRRMKCNLCKLGFSTLPSLKAHQNREHGSDHVLCKSKRRVTGKSYQCDSCGKTYRNCYQLREHDNYYHKKIFTAVCTVCSKAFPTKALLLKHYIVHSGEKPYKCDECGEAYKNSSCLDSHVLRHRNGRFKGKRKQ